MLPRCPFQLVQDALEKAAKDNGTGQGNGKGNQGQGASNSAGHAQGPKEPGRIKGDQNAPSESEQPESPLPS